MKKFLCVMVLLFTASCSNQANIDMAELSPIKDNTSISSNDSKISYLRGDNSTIINKEPAIKRLTGNEIYTIAKTGRLEPTEELYVITFSKGAGVGTIGLLVMYLQKSGKSELAMSRNYHTNIPTKLSFEETKKLLKSASNYKSNTDKLAKLFGA